MHATIKTILQQLNSVILGKEVPLKLALACLLARGHLLIEDIPGVGKTTLSHALAATLGLKYSRIQFTSDLLPADILGSAIYERESGKFHFHAGPIFSQLVLADEINRATPKTQSALLEAMEEQQVSIEGETRPLPDPFFVIATQNPSFQVGTFPLPESQLDRFLMRIQLGYPDAAAERQLLAGNSGRERLNKLSAVTTTPQLLALQQQVSQVQCTDALINYLQALLSFSREAPYFSNGLSPRSGLGLLQAAKAWAFIEGRDYLLPEDLQQLLPYVAGHRLISQEVGEHYSSDALLNLFHEVAVR
ncbi:MAG: AAA family ATPase [Gammaproteobacteria bacterium]|nr:AAA family ATPase [Gammaproteobacteria bacterium]MCF6230563.1 AAA family ATPase [Gammaproteobacteria bacterium]